MLSSAGLFADDPNGGKALKVYNIDGVQQIPFFLQLTEQQSLEGGTFELIPNFEDTSFFLFAVQAIAIYTFKDNALNNSDMVIVGGGDITDPQFFLSKSIFHGSSTSILVPFTPKGATADGFFSTPSKGLFLNLGTSASGNGYYTVAGFAVKYPVPVPPPEPES